MSRYYKAHIHDGDDGGIPSQVDVYLSWPDVCDARSGMEMVGSMIEEWAKEVADEFVLEEHPDVDLDDYERDVETIDLAIEDGIELIKVPVKFRRIEIEEDEE
jgi:hypothetical protein